MSKTSVAMIQTTYGQIDAFFNLMFEQRPPTSTWRRAIHRCCASMANSSAYIIRRWKTTAQGNLYEISPDYNIKQFEETCDVDFGYEFPNVLGFRVNFFNQKNGISSVFRQIPSRVLSFEDFEKLEATLPPVQFGMLHRGLVVVTGPTAPANPPHWPPLWTTPTATAKTTSSRLKIR